MSDPMNDALERAFAHARAHLAALDTAPVGPTVDLAALRARLGKPLPEMGLAGAQVVDELVADLAGGILGSAGGRFFGWVIGGALPAALAADWLVSAWDQNASVYACSPASAVVEEVAGAWVKSILGLPAKASFALTTGCQLAHVTCLAAARHGLLEARGWDVEAQGLCGAPRIRVVTSDAAHGTLERAVRLLGLGRANVIVIPSDDAGRLPPPALEQELARCAGDPTIVVLQAGDVNTGAFDEFERLVPLAQRAGAWVHVDGAFGLWAAAVPSLQRLLAGVEYADSWASDAHKWLNVPYDSGLAFVAHPAAHRAAFAHRASYMSHEAAARDQIDWNAEWSRRARGFAIYAALRELGRTGVGQLVERSCRQAAALVEGMAAIPGVEVLAAPIINQALVRFPDPRPAATPEDHDLRTDEVIARIVAGGEAFFGGTTWRGRRAMRISVCNWRTSDADLRRTVRAVAAALNESS